MKRKYKILFNGNFYFPVIDKGKKFVVEDTIDLDIEEKYNQLIKTCLEFYKQSEDLDFGMLARPIWDACKEYCKEYEYCWLFPILLSKMGDKYTCMVDILKKVK